MQSRQAHLLTSHRTGLWLQCWRWSWRWRWLWYCFCCLCCWNWCWRWFWRWLYFEPDVILDPPVSEMPFHLKLFGLFGLFSQHFCVWKYWPWETRYNETLGSPHSLLPPAKKLVEGQYSLNTIQLKGAGLSKIKSSTNLFWVCVWVRLGDELCFFCSHLFRFFFKTFKVNNFDIEF